MSQQDQPSIALVIHALNGGGAERLMSQLANRWSALGYSVTLITLASVDTDTYSVDSSVKRVGLDAMSHSASLMKGLLANWQRIRLLRAALVSARPRLIVSFCDRMNILTGFAAKGLGVPLWLAEHSDPRHQSLGMTWELLRNRAYRSASGCIVLTPDIARWMTKRLQNRIPVKIIPPAVQLPLNLPGPHAGAMADSASDSSRKTLVHLGRHSAEKNVSGLIQAWSQIAEQLPEWRLTLAGAGPEHERLRQLASTCGASDSIQFLGWVENPWQLFASSQGFILSSHYEGFPVSLLEAMSAGIPCMSTPCCDMVHTFQNAGGLTLAASTESKAMSTAMLRWLQDEPMRRAQAARAVELAAEYTWERIGPLWDQLARDAFAEIKNQ